MKDDNAVYVLPWCHLASFTLNWNMSYETRFCPVTGAAVNAHRASLQVDFAVADCCVAPTRSSLLPGKSYLSCSLLLVIIFVSISIAVETFFVNGFWRKRQGCCKCHCNSPGAFVYSDRPCIHRYFGSTMLVLRSNVSRLNT